MSVPKRKVTKGRRDRRRAHDACTRPTFMVCPACQATKPAHRICPSCGQYKGRTVLTVKEE